MDPARYVLLWQLSDLLRHYRQNRLGWVTFFPYLGWDEVNW